MRPLLLPALLCSGLVGCATGAPVGARAGLDDARYRPFIRAGARAQVPEVAAALPSAPGVRAGARERVLEAARAQVGRKTVVVAGRAWPDDCTGLVKAVFSREGLDLAQLAQPGDNGVTAIWRFAQARGRTFQGGHPVPGDLVFFKETYDRNRDGAANDGLTHVGIVEAQDADGTLGVIHRVARGVVRYRMNLGRPDAARDAGGKVLNDWLRPPERGQKPLLTAQLFYGFATLLPVESRYAAR